MDDNVVLLRFQLMHGNQIVGPPHENLSCSYVTVQRPKLSNLWIEGRIIFFYQERPSDAVGTHVSTMV